MAVATLWHEDLPPYEVDEGVRVFRLRASLLWLHRFLADQGRLHLPPLPDPEVTAGLRRLVAQERPEVVHAHNCLIHSFLPLKAWSGAKLVRSLHDYSFGCANTVLTHDGTV